MKKSDNIFIAGHNGLVGSSVLKLLKNKPAKAIPELIKHTHFNTEHPENQNIKITNKKEPYIKVRKNNKWELQDKDETITDLIDRQQIHLLDEDVEKKIEESDRPDSDSPLSTNNFGAQQ